MAEIEKDGFITNEKDVSVSENVGCDWARSIRCRDCFYAYTKGGVAMRLWCKMHEKNVDADHWCVYGKKG